MKLKKFKNKKKIKKKEQKSWN